MKTFDFQCRCGKKHSGVLYPGATSVVCGFCNWETSVTILVLTDIPELNPCDFQQMRTVIAENARLRKELEAAQFAAKAAREQSKVMAENSVPCDHEATISKLRAFGEDQAKQIAGLEHAKSVFENEHRGARELLKDAWNRIGELTRELEKAKRSK